MYPKFSSCSLPQKRLPVTYTVVLLKVDGELGNHDGILHVHLHPIQSLNAFLASVPCHTHQSQDILMGENLLAMASQMPMVWQTWTAPSMK